MNGTARPWSALPVAAGALVVAGATAVVLPQHALGIARVLVATLVVLALVATARHALLDVVLDQPGMIDLRSPFESTAVRRRFHRDRPTSLDRMRSELSTGFVRADVAALSPAAARRLAAIVTTALEREGLDLDDPAHRPAVQARLSPQALAAITAERSLRGPRGHQALPRRTASAEEIAATVHAVLDELDRPPTLRGAR